MAKDFIKVKDARIRISTIKRYAPFGDSKLVIRFSSSTKDTQSEHFTFDSVKERDDVLDVLDLLCFQ